MGEQHNRQGKQSAIWCAPTEHVEVTFGVASLFKVVVKRLNGGLGVRCAVAGAGVAGARGGT
eukprot:scaffold45164_cov58-Phaeocystis_antarctica.AAC.1